MRFSRLVYSPFLGRIRHYSSNKVGGSEYPKCSCSHLPLQLVGFIGLGNMGAPMASNLVKKGHQLVVFDVVQSAVQSAVAAGAIKADSPSQVRLAVDKNMSYTTTIGSSSSPHSDHYAACKCSCS